MMFDDPAYSRLSASPEFKGFKRNCYIGFLCTYFVFAALLLCVLINIEKAANAVIFVLIAELLGAAVCAVIINRSLKKQPFLCSYGSVTSKNGRHAVITVNGTDFKATSFENFLRSKSLDGYNIGDEVLIYSGAKKNSRPLFFHK